MKTYDRLRIAVKSLRGKWAVLPALGMAIAAFCLCFAGAAGASVQQEKSLPYELSITLGSSGVSDNLIAEIFKIEDVTAATAVMEVPASIEADGCAAELTLVGMDAAYIMDQFQEGGVFPESGVMPYIVLNEAALKQFKAEKKDTPQSGDWSEPSESRSEAPEADWMNAAVTIQAGEEARPIVAKICGIMDEASDEQEPAAYISLSSAKSLLAESGQPSEYTGALIRVKNIGCAETVTKEIGKLGLSVDNSAGDLQEGWDMKLREMTYLMVVGAFCLLCSAALMAAWRRISLLEDAEMYRTLLWVGMLKKDILRMFTLQTLIISVAGAVIGALVSLVLPPFLTAGGSESSIYMLPVPGLIAALSVGVCAIAGALSMLVDRRKRGL